MAFKLDFEKLRRDSERFNAMMPEEQDAHRRREAFEQDAPHVARDEAERDAGSKDRLVVVLEEHPSWRHSHAGGMDVRLHFREEGRDGVKPAWYLASEAERGGVYGDSPEKGLLEAKLARLDAGSTVTLLGSWKPRSFKDSSGAWQKVFEFRAQRFAEGDVSREDLARRVPGGLAERSESFQASKAAGAGQVRAGLKGPAPEAIETPGLSSRLGAER